MQDYQTNSHPEQNDNVAVAEMQPDAPIAATNEQTTEATNAPRSTDQALSQREKQVVRMIGGGKTVGQIAVELNLSVKTVSTYRVRALHKLGMTTNADLMRYAIQHKLEESAAAETNTPAESAVENSVDAAPTMSMPTSESDDSSTDTNEASEDRNS